MGYYRWFLRELDLLQRTERLFARFPNSLHPLIVQHLHLEVAPAGDDEAFEQALKEDAELHEFLKMSFWLPRRLEFIRESVDSFAKRKRFGEFLVQCQACYVGSMCLEEKFFEQLGHACE